MSYTIMIHSFCNHSDDIESQMLFSGWSLSERVINVTAINRLHLTHFMNYIRVYIRIAFMLHRHVTYLLTHLLH